MALALQFSFKAFLQVIESELKSYRPYSYKEKSLHIICDRGNCVHRWDAYALEIQNYSLDLVSINGVLSFIIGLKQWRHKATL